MKPARISKKYPVLEYIFRKYYNPDKKQDIIPFYLSDISEGYKACKTLEPVSISNTILDLTRQDRGIASRVPKSILNLGYDLRKKTGRDSNGKNFAGEFVQVGLGNSLKSWLIWPEPEEIIKINSSSIPQIVMKLIRPDEGGLFSVIDYTDIFSKVFFQEKIKVFRIQNPMKWQPNEIDGFYGYQQHNKIEVFAVEAKALVTKDEINLDQLSGGFETFLGKMRKLDLQGLSIRQVAIKMIPNGIDIVIFPANKLPINPEKFYRVIFDPPIKNWH